MPGGYCPHCRCVHEPVDETQAEIDAIDAAMETLRWIGMAAIALVVLLGVLLA
jgi:hypothetical protein